MFAGMVIVVKGTKHLEMISKPEVKTPIGGRACIIFFFFGGDKKNGSTIVL